MPSILKPTIHSSVASAAYKSIMAKRSVFYFFTGKTTPWNNDSTPDTPLYTKEFENYTRNNISQMKRIGIYDISFVVPRYDWISGNVYDMYDDYSDSHLSYSGANSLYKSKFYVLVDNKFVFKCLDNNNNSPSIIKPVGTGVETIKTSDGYVWKYMFTLPAVVASKFLNSIYMPVVNSVALQNTSTQSIINVQIDNPGSGYSDSSPLVSAVVEDTTGFGARIRLSISPIDGRIATAFVSAEGYNYSSNATIKIIDTSHKGTGIYGNSTAILSPVIYNGKLVSVLIKDPGKNYPIDSSTNITVTGDGYGAILSPIIENGCLVDVIIENGGYNYSVISAEVLSGMGSGAKISIQLGTISVDSDQYNVEQTAVPGTINAVRIENGGSNYTYATISVSGDGTGLSVTPVITNGVITKVNVVSPGSGYSWAELTVTGNESVTGAITAKLNAIISPINGHGSNAIEELGADSITFYTSLSNDKNQGIEITNEYRQFGIIENPTKITGEPFTELSGSVCYRVVMSNNTLLNQNDILTSTLNQYHQIVVIGTDAATKSAIVSTTGKFDLAAGQTWLRKTDGITFNILSVMYQPEIDKFSGNMVFLDNKKPTSQSPDQIVTERVTLQF